MTHPIANRTGQRPLIALVLLLAAMLGALAPVWSSAQAADPYRNQHSIAVLIANQNYQRTHPVDYALNDVAAMKAFLLEKLGYEEQNIFILRDARAAQLRDWFGNEHSSNGELRRLVESGIPLQDGKRLADIFVYYSGHGAPDPIEKKNFLIPVDVSPNEARYGLGVATLERNLEEIGELLGPNNRVFLMMEACFSGESSSGALIQSSAGALVFSMEATAGVVRLAAAASDQVAFWDAESRRGLFTQHFLEGAEGEADSPEFFGDGDGIVEFKELQLYVRRQVHRTALRLRSRAQTPEFTAQREVDWQFLPGPITPVALDGAEAGANEPQTEPAEPNGLSEAEAYTLAEQVGTMEGWDAFLSQHPEGPRAPFARAHRQRLANARAAEDQAAQERIYREQQERERREREERERLANLQRPPTTPQPPLSTDCGHPRGNWRVTGVASNDTLNVRRGPRTTYRITGEIPYDGSGIEVTQCDSRNWCYVRYRCIEGWANGKYLTVAGGGGQPTPPQNSGGAYRVVGVASNDVLNMRSGPGPSYGRIGAIPYNGTGIAVQRCVQPAGSASWCYVSYGGARGWVSSQFLGQ